MGSFVFEVSASGSDVCVSGSPELVSDYLAVVCVDPTCWSVVDDVVSRVDVPVSSVVYNVSGMCPEFDL